MFEILAGIALIVFAQKTAPALARRLSGQTMDGTAARRLEDLEQRIAQNEDRLLEFSAGAHDRMMEVEERLDFAERVLQQQRQQHKLPPQ
jgi:hypothetical protein